MIADKIENAGLYRNLSSGIKAGLEFVQKTDLLAIEPGEYNIAEGIFAIVAEYQTKPAIESKPEAHKKYIDIQYIIKGEEYIGYAPLENQEIATEYDEKNDFMFLDAEISFTKMTTGMFAIYYPTDIHQPGIVIDKPAAIKKVVVKVAV